MSGRALFAQAICVLLVILADHRGDTFALHLFTAASFIIMGCAPHRPTTPSTEGQGA